MITHAKPSIDIIRSLNTIPGGITLPHYEDMKLGAYNGPPVQYTACTQLVYDVNKWDVKKGTQLFSNEHDPRLKIARFEKEQRITRFIYEESILENKEFFRNLDEKQKEMKDINIPLSLLENKRSSQNIIIENENGQKIKFKLPFDYRFGQKIIVKYI